MTPHQFHMSARRKRLLKRIGIESRLYLLAEDVSKENSLLKLTPLMKTPM